MTGWWLATRGTIRGSVGHPHKMCHNDRQCALSALVDNSRKCLETVPTLVDLVR